MSMGKVEVSVPECRKGSFADRMLIIDRISLFTGSSSALLIYGHDGKSQRQRRMHCSRLTINQLISDQSSRPFSLHHLTGIHHSSLCIAVE
jgi:hypothetical protein